MTSALMVRGPGWTGALGAVCRLLRDDEPLAGGGGFVRRGRPVDVLVAPDGALLISDDRVGVIYRVSYTGGA